jgi:hypothetical protein
MEPTIFFAWQDDLPAEQYKNFIRSCLDAAIKQLRRSEVLYEAIRRDEATMDEAGWPDIVATLLGKIEECSVFVADLSPIARTRRAEIAPARLLPNPNVLFEAGYALAKLAPSQITPIINEEALDAARLDDLPFDVRGRRLLTYQLGPGDDIKAKRAEFTPRLKAALELAIEKGPRELLRRFLKETDPDLVRRLDAGEKDLHVMVASHRIAKLWSIAALPATSRMATIVSTGATAASNRNQAGGHTNDRSSGPLEGVRIMFK